MTSSVWPPPAPPEYVDRTQLPANLLPSSLAFQRRDKDDDDNGDDVSEVTRPTDDAEAQLMRQRSSGSEARPLSTVRAGTDDVMTSERDIQQHDGCEFDHTSETVAQRERRQSDLSYDKEPGPSQQLKRSSSYAADDLEPGMQVKRQPDTVMSCDSSSAVMEVDHSAADEATTRHAQVHGTVSRDQTQPQMPTMPPRLMVPSDEPMVIEFSAVSGASSSTNDDDVSVRAGHKRARINSGTVHNDVIKQSFVKRPVTFYGNFAVFLLQSDINLIVMSTSVSLYIYIKLVHVVHKIRKKEKNIERYISWYTGAE